MLNEECACVLASEPTDSMVPKLVILVSILFYSFTAACGTTTTVHSIFKEHRKGMICEHTSSKVIPCLLHQYNKGQLSPIFFFCIVKIKTSSQVHFAFHLEGKKPASFKITPFPMSFPMLKKTLLASILLFACSSR